MTEPARNESLQLRDYVQLLRRYFPLIIACGVIGLGCGWGYDVTQPRVYAASASGLVTAGGSQSAGDASVASQVALARVPSYVVLAQSRAVADRAAKLLGVPPDQSLAGAVSAGSSAETPLIQITATAGDAKSASRLANAYIQALSLEVRDIENPKGTRRSILTLVPVDAAVQPSAPISPNLDKDLLYGGVLGLALGLGLALLRYLLDRRVRDANDVTRFGLTVAGILPSDGMFANRRNSVALDEGWQPAGEAILKLRTNLQFMDVDHPPRVIVVTSPMPGEGKSTVAANLATAIAASDRPVVLIDGDLRKPVQAESFEVPEGAGLTDVLIGRVSADDVLQQPREGLPLFLLAAGRRPPNPSELLGSAAMRHLLQELSQLHTVIIDAPPLLPVTDAAVLTVNADGALVVITSEKTRDRQLGDALDNLYAVNGHVLGVVFNRVKRSRLKKRYGYGSYYGQPTLDPEEFASESPVSVGS